MKQQTSQSPTLEGRHAVAKSLAETNVAAGAGRHTVVGKGEIA
jgi:hypothetical protein